MKKFIATFMAMILSLVPLTSNAVDVEYLVDKNGEYSFELEDKSGRKSTLTVQVENIDLLGPEFKEMQLYHSKDEGKLNRYYISTDSTLVLNYTDDASQVDKIYYKVVKAKNQLNEGGKDNNIPSKEEFELFNNKLEVIPKEEGLYSVYQYAVDVAGNESNIIRKDYMYDATPPTLDCKTSNTAWTGDEVKITVSTNDDISKVKVVVLPNGVKNEKLAQEFVVKKNGIYEFSSIDNAGLKSTETVVIDNIEIEKPLPPQNVVTEDELENLPEDKLESPDDEELQWEKEPTTVNILSRAPSGIAYYKYTVEDVTPGRINPEQKMNTADVSVFNTDINLAGTTALNTLQVRDILSNQNATEQFKNKSLRTPSKLEKWETTTTPKIVIEEEGIFIVEVFAVSNANNSSKVSKYIVKNDYTPPTVDTKTSGHQVVLEAEDNLSGCKTITCGCGTTEGSIKICNEITGTHTYVVKDAAGNETKRVVQLSSGNPEEDLDDWYEPADNPETKPAEDSKPNNKEESNNSANKPNEENNSANKPNEENSSSGVIDNPKDADTDADQSSGIIDNPDKDSNNSGTTDNTNNSDKDHIFNEDFDPILDKEHGVGNSDPRIDNEDNNDISNTIKDSDLTSGDTEESGNSSDKNSKSELERDILDLVNNFLKGFLLATILTAIVTAALGLLLAGPLGLILSKWLLMLIAIILGLLGLLIASLTKLGKWLINLPYLIELLKWFSQLPFCFAILVQFFILMLLILIIITIYQRFRILQDTQKLAKLEDDAEEILEE